jgi:sigma-B regulation protein RsbU (phosphoserine phosphatase)
VSGDFYDVFPLGRGDLLLALGDVCGKGAEAAAITAIARHTIRAVAPDMRHPCQILRRLNETMLGHDLDERFCSVVVARVTPIVGGVRMSVCCAGHVPPIVVRANRKVERVGWPGTLLGLFPGIRLLEETVQLQRGDMIVAFTDGVTEATRNGEEFGEERAEEILSACVGTSATEAVSTLLDEVLRFGGQRSRDDIAILALRVADG